MSKFTPKQTGIIILTIITALIHLIAGIRFGNTLFILNFLGYIALLAGLYFIPQLIAQRSMIRWAFIAYTAVTIILYFVFNWPDVGNPMGLFDKAIEIALVVLLWLDR